MAKAWLEIAQFSKLSIIGNNETEKILIIWKLLKSKAAFGNFKVILFIRLSAGKEKAMCKPPSHSLNPRKGVMWIKLQSNYLAPIACKTSEKKKIIWNCYETESNNNRFSCLSCTDNKIIIFSVFIQSLFRKKKQQKDWKSSKQRREERAQPEQRAVNKSLYYSRMYDIFYKYKLHKIFIFYSRMVWPSTNKADRHFMSDCSIIDLHHRPPGSTHKIFNSIFCSRPWPKNTDTKFVDNKPTSTVDSPEYRLERSTTIR